MRMLAKEFPILKKTEEGKETFRSCNADYLMCDDGTVYLVELKTTQGSYRNSQMENYIKECENEDTFAKSLGRNFIRLLNHVSKTGKLQEEFAKKIDQPEPGKDVLEQLFELIIKQAKNPESCEEQEESYTSRARRYLQREKAVSSKKYLFTAGQMLEQMKKDDKWWNEHRELKVLYLIPEDLGDTVNSDNVIVVTFKDVISQKDKIEEKIKKDHSDLLSYWEWAANILEQCRPDMIQD